MRVAAIRRVVAPVFFAAVTLASLALGPGTATAGQAVLTWEAPTTMADGSPLADLAGYRVYIGTAPGEYQQAVDAGDTRIYLADDLRAGTTYYFAVTAYSSSGEESVYSEEVSKSFEPDASTAPPAANPTAPPAAIPTFTIADALSALKYAVASTPLTSDQLARYDMAPMDADGTPRPDGTIDVSDAVVILRRAVGLDGR